MINVYTFLGLSCTVSLVNGRVYVGHFVSRDDNNLVIFKQANQPEHEFVVFIESSVISIEYDV